VSDMSIPTILQAEKRKCTRRPSQIARDLVTQSN
jgi:hypothetical protein